MTTDSGLGYLSGLLRAGAEPLGPAGHAPRRRARVPTHPPTSHHASPSSPSAPADYADTSEVPQPLQDDTPEHAAHVSASERDNPAEQTIHTNSAQTIHTNSAQTTPADSGSTIHTNSASIIPADSASTIPAKGLEVSDAAHTAAPNAPLDDAAVERAAQIAAQPHASPHTHLSSALPPDEAAVVEHRSHEKSQGLASPSFVPDARPASASSQASLTPATNHATRAASRRRAASSADKRGGETKRTAIVTSEQANTSATSGQPDAEAPPAQFQANAEESLRRSQAETFNLAAPRIEVASAAEDMTTAYTEDMTTAYTMSVADNVLPARAAARREPPVRVSHTPPQVRPPQRRESDLTSAGESDAAREAEGASGDADSTPYTLEEHIGQLRSLMQPKGAEIQDATGDESAPAVSARQRRATTARAQMKETGARLVTNAETRSTPTATRAQSGKDVDGARDELRARGETVGAKLSPARDSDELNLESGLAPRAGLSFAPTDMASVEKQPLKVKPTRGPAAAARLAGLPGTTNERPDTNEPPSTNERAVVPHVAANARASAPAPTRQSGRVGEVASGAARAPKLTINRLDVQVVNRSEPTPPPPPAQPAPEQPSQPDPWGAPDRQFLGRFFY